MKQFPLSKNVCINLMMHFLIKPNMLALLREFLNDSSQDHEHFLIKLLASVRIGCIRGYLRPQKCRQVELLRGELFTQGMVSGVA
jgi:hypothetical protein